MGEQSVCWYCKRTFEPNGTRACSEDCFYAGIYWGNSEHPGVFGSPHFRLKEPK